MTIEWEKEIFVEYEKARNIDLAVDTILKKEAIEGVDMVMGVRKQLE